MIPVLTGSQWAWLAQAAKLRVHLEQQDAMRRNGGNARPNAELAELLGLLDTLASYWRQTVRGTPELPDVGDADAAGCEWDSEQAAGELGLSSRQVRKLASGDGLPDLPGRLPGRKTRHGWRFDPDDVLRLKEHRANQDQG